MENVISDQKLSILKDKLVKANDILIFTHTFLDPDALGSMLALADLIKSWKGETKNSRKSDINNINKHSRVTPIVFEPPLEQSQRPSKLDVSDLFVALTENDVSIVEQKIKQADLIFIVDTASYSRAVKGEKLASLLENNQDKIVIIDHHKTSVSSTPFLMFRTPAASCAQLIYEIFAKNLKAPLTIQSALAILFGILGDTQMLRFLPTNESYVVGYIEEILSYLNEKLPGKLLTDVAEALDLKLDLVSIPVFQEMVKNLRIKHGIAGTYISNTYGLNAQQLNIARLFMLYSVLGKVKGVKIYFTVRPDLERNSVFIGSLRSKGNIDVSKIAQKYNGGGHKNAAGCDVEAKTAKQAFKMLWQELEQLL